MTKIEALSRKTKEKELRKQLILAAAKELFFEHSYEKTSMDAIAQKVGLAKGTLYLYFSNKDELYISLLNEGLTILKEMMVAKGKLFDNPEDKFVHSLAIAYYEFSVEHPQYFSLMMNFHTGNIAKMDCVHEDVTGEIVQKDTELLQYCMSIVQEGIDFGVFITSEDPRLVVMQLWFSIFGAIVMMRYHCASEELLKEHDPLLGINQKSIIESIANRFVKSLKI